MDQETIHILNWLVIETYDKILIIFNPLQSTVANKTISLSFFPPKIMQFWGVGSIGDGHIPKLEELHQALPKIYSIKEN